jgi:hypothetical protein
VKIGGVAQRFTTLANRLWGLGEQGAPLELVPEVLPTYDLANPRLEYLLPRGEIPFHDAGGYAATAAEFSYVGIENPAGSRRCVVVERLIGYSSSDDVYSIISDPFTATEYDGIASMDGRHHKDSGVVRRMQGHLAANPAGSLVGARIDLTGGVMLYGGFAVIPPGKSWLLRGLTVNVIVQCSFFGYMRACSPEEMNV